MASPPPATPHFDYFITYAAADSAWVEGYLLEALRQAGVRCHVEAAFSLGAPRLLEFERAIQNSRRVLLVLSPDFLGAETNAFVALLAQAYGLETATWPVIPLIFRPAPLPPRLALLQSLDATDADTWPDVIERLCREAQRPPPAPAPLPPCPYPGMAPFTERDASRFFGRDVEIQDLLHRLHSHPFLAVIGPSGSGKSSLVLAGLIPALRASGLFGPGTWQVQTLRPGRQPLQALSVRFPDQAAPADAATLRAYLEAQGAARLLLVVDQFEECFTQAEAGAREFQEALAALARMPGCYVILTARADFYAELMACPLWPAIRDHRVEILPLDAGGLREAVVRPAEAEGVFVETALVERLLSDGAGEPGVLPLLQEMLRLLWEKIERRYLPLRAYETLTLPRSAYGPAGKPPRTGLQAAMAYHADAVLAALDEDARAIARRIFLRLVHFGEGRRDTRQQQPVSALRAAGDDPAAFQATLSHLTAARLLTMTAPAEAAQEPRVDLAHEALIEGWPAFQGWLAAQREVEKARRRLEAKAAEWVRLGQGVGGLLDAVELAEAEAWLSGPDAERLGAGTALIALVEASRRALTLQQAREAEQQQRLAQEQAGRFTAERGRRRVIVALFLLVALPLAALLLWAGYREHVRRSTGTELVWISGGMALLGSARADSTRVTELLSYQLEKYEVSNAQYLACIRAGPCTAPQANAVYDNPLMAHYPITNVHAQQAQIYCNWLSRRLPTNVEWEWAARIYGAAGKTDATLRRAPVPVRPEAGANLVSSEQIFHLLDNVSELVVLVPNDCQRDACHAAWNGKTGPVGVMGGAYDRNIEGYDDMLYVGIERADYSTGFRCAGSVARSVAQSH